MGRFTITDSYTFYEYIEWFGKHTLTAEQLSEQKEQSKKFRYRPLISILLPTYNTNPEYLRICIDSELAQSYDNWELCISDDNSTNEQTKHVVREYVKKYDNITATFRKKNGHIAESSNTALAMAKVHLQFQSCFAMHNFAFLLEEHYPWLQAH